MAYATRAEFDQVVIDNDSIPPEGDIDAALERASRDLDAYLAWPAPVADNLRIDVDLLTEYQAAALARATCEQAAYRLQRGEADMSMDQDGISAVAGISFASQPPPRIGPAVKEALQDAGLFMRSGCAPPPYGL